MVIEVDEFIVLACRLTDSDVHESRVFQSVWDELPDSITPRRSLADAAYCGEACLAAARKRGATPLHKIRKNARGFEEPKTLYQKIVNFAHHWPQRSAALTGKRNHAETVFSMIDKALGYRLRFRKKDGRRNEIRCKFARFNVLQLAMRKEFWS